MTLLASLPRIEEHRVSVVFDCPKCRAALVRGTAYNLRETIRLTDRVPAWGWSSHWVRCSHCGAELSADCEPKAFHGCSPSKVSDRVHPYLSFPKRVLAVASAAMGWVPVLGVLVAIVSMAMNARTRGWPRVLSMVTLALTTAYNVALFTALVMWSIEAARPIGV